ncbi:hypothetical protein K438DRAFT_1931376 [Mycena galopus ATCC 62051]|nr:hypothetical protein K438DRAFT_1931376 [Mycena galopus ATCC 62051]
MTTTNFTIDNVNPLIQYSPVGAWVAGNDSADPLGYLYSNGGTFEVCTTQGSSATFTFNGTQVYLFGAKRVNHGPYSVTLDGIETTYSGFSENAVFGPIFISDVLKAGLHTVTLTNQMENMTFPYVDLDYITWTTIMPNNNESQTIEDTDPSFTYSPASSWTTDISGLQLTGFSGNSGHATLTSDASVSVSFSGTFISIFGPVGPTISLYTAQLDGVEEGTFNGTQAEAYTSQEVLYTATDLADGPHTLQLTLQSTGILAIDYVQVSPTSTSTAIAGAASGGVSASLSSSALGLASGSASAASTTTTGAVAAAKNSDSRVIGSAVGGAVGCAIIIAIFALLAFSISRRKQRRGQDAHMPVDLTETKEPSYALAPTPYTMGQATMPSYITGGTLTPNRYSPPGSQVPLVPQAQYRDTHLAIPTTPYSGVGMDSPSDSTSAMDGPYTERRIHFTDETTRGSMPDGSVGRSTVESAGAAGLGAGGDTLRRKSVQILLPPTANVPLPPGATRMYVPGREQDMGLAPPDYKQATEPYQTV